MLKSERTHDYIWTNLDEGNVKAGNRNGSMQRQDCRFHGQQLRRPQAETSAGGILLCSGSHRFRLF